MYSGCAALGGRLPSTQEVLGIVDPAAASPKVVGYGCAFTNFVTTPSQSRVWTSDTASVVCGNNNGYEGRAYVVYFSSGVAQTSTTSTCSYPVYYPEGRYLCVK